MNENINQNLDIKDLEREIWKPIKEYEKLYEVSNLGRIKSLEHFVIGKKHSLRKIGNKIRKLSSDKRGYPSITLIKNNKYHKERVHRVVAKTFIPNYKNLREVNHKNGIKTDNKIENLEWVTSQQNIQHALKNGLLHWNKGSLNHNSKLNENQIKEIRQKYDTNQFTQQNLAELFNVDQTSISLIILRKYWKHVK